MVDRGVLTGDEDVVRGEVLHGVQDRLVRWVQDRLVRWVHDIVVRWVYMVYRVGRRSRPFGKISW